MKSFSFLVLVRRLRITFSHFDLEGSAPTCYSDAVVVTQPGNTTLGPFCGSDLPAEITSSGNRLDVRFTTDISGVTDLR